MNNLIIRNIFNLLLATLLLFLISCGKNDKSSSSASSQESVQQQDNQGIYRAILAPVNLRANESIAGTVIIKVKDDELSINQNVTGAPAGIKHYQQIHMGSECPTETSDLNKDGYVDAEEGLQVYGRIIIPLDSDLNSQANGSDYGPIANESGNYVYKETASLKELLSDLNLEDLNSEDSLTKLKGDHLNLDGKVIIIQGLSSKIDVPHSIASIEGLTAHESLPIACGKIVRIQDEDSEL